MVDGRSLGGVEAASLKMRCASGTLESMSVSSLKARAANFRLSGRNAAGVGVSVVPDVVAGEVAVACHG
eukprot:1284409-Rhodomonas_salina.1